MSTIAADSSSPSVDLDGYRFHYHDIGDRSR
jgi:hypothetical protein